ncbi:MAG: hypothetical protein M1819_003696 [Sarea resinae]|nr:MAG: hypothetical protein M1819_003696 [Sarea resinae]
MLAARSIRTVCALCRLRMLARTETVSVRSFQTSTRYYQPRIRPQLSHSSARELDDDLQEDTLEPQDTKDAPARTQEQMEELVLRARRFFGESLPEGVLGVEEYKLYERLYGPPLQHPAEEDDLIEGNSDDAQETLGNALFRENKDGELEEVEDDLHPSDSESSHGHDLTILNDISKALHPKEQGQGDEAQTARAEQRPAGLVDNGSSELSSIDIDDDAELDDINKYETSDSQRSHPLTVAGRFSMNHTTIQLPKASFTEPITSLLTDSSNKHLSDVAERVFGGRGLPFSTSTPSSMKHLEQKPLSLEASQSKMAEMEADVYLAAIMPGAYAGILSTLVEVRKRLGAEWIEELLKKEGGPRVLDAGAGGAGVIAWREILKAETERIREYNATSSAPEEEEEQHLPPQGKATVVTGSSSLRHRASKLLDNTTFLPRLPDTIPSSSSSPRKLYDLILAPYTIQHFTEPHTRKAHIQNLWSLLDPAGGVLVLLEKGHPRGFEAIAGARQMLLDTHISSPNAETYNTELEAPEMDPHTKKESGMIIAPCTNHAKCPMYLTEGKSAGRKDFCHFSQRYIRPPYLQRLLHAKGGRNHEDVAFSYLAVRRGRDDRVARNLVQGDEATDSAFAGHEHEHEHENENDHARAEPDKTISTLSLPRSILPPLKRRGHIILDLCTPSGTLERWTVPKSFSKLAYRDARKSAWGDLWALGAKTRVAREVRLGKGLLPRRKGDKGKAVKDGRRKMTGDDDDGDDGGVQFAAGHGNGKGAGRGKGKQVFNVEIGDDGEVEGVRRAVGGLMGRAEHGKGKKKGRKGRQGRDGDDARAGRDLLDEDII